MQLNKEERKKGMKEGLLSLRRAGIALCPFALAALLYVGGTPAERSGTTSDRASIELALATVKEGDVLTFIDGRLCRVLEDRTADNLMIRYACADEPQVIISTEAGPLAAQLGAVSPPVDKASRIARLIVWERASENGQMSETR